MRPEEFVEASGLIIVLIQIEALRERDERLVARTCLRELPVVEDSMWSLIGRRIRSRIVKRR
ncbi:hypothetical protein DF143_37380 [Burkholderia cenocepacia]|nr:hypothetical protein DF143_37380 [Burkholderia cenocepacia]RQV31821.1 hypothetical protein DF033_36940 [Burkholderia cenocepacia]